MAPRSGRSRSCCARPAGLPDRAQGEGEYLGNRFDGEGLIRVAYLGMGAITEHDADAEEVGWHLGQVRNVAGIFTVLIT